MVSLLDFVFRPLFSGLAKTPDRPPPLARNIIQDPKQTLALPAFLENLRQRKFELEVERPFLLQQLGRVRGFQKSVFKITPFQKARARLIKRVGPFRAKRIIRGSQSIDGARVPAQRGGAVAAGLRFSIDPFTGQRVLIGFGKRASPKTRSFFGDPSANLRRVTQGNLLAGQINDLIKIFQARISIIDTKSV